PHKWHQMNMISGKTLGDKLNAAGFDGARPGAKVDVLSCNAATPPFLGGTSVAQAVANRTLADATGPRAIGGSALLGTFGLSGATRTSGLGVYQDGPLTGRIFYTPGRGGSGPATEHVNGGGKLVTVSPQPGKR